MESQERKIVLYAFEPVRGFFSWINGILMAILICKQNNWKLAFDYENFWHKYEKGLCDYLNIYDNDVVIPIESITPTDIILNPYTHLQQWVTSDLRLKFFYHYDLQSIEIPEWQIRKDDPIFEKIRKVTTHIWKPNSKYQEQITKYMETLPQHYSVLNCRRGDKITTNEAQFIETNHMLNEVLKHCPQTTTIYHITDDYKSFNELEELVKTTHPHIQVLTNCLPHEHGYFIQEFHRMTKGQLEEHVYRQILLSIEIARQSEVYVGTYSSNYCRFIPLIHKNPEKCLSMDIPWHQNPNI